MEIHEILLLLLMAVAVVAGAAWAASELGGVAEWFADTDFERHAVPATDEQRR